MFQFPGFASAPYGFGYGYPLARVGFPIRKSSDQGLFAGSPRLIADYHVLLRLLPPRHPPYALARLTVQPQSARVARAAFALFEMQSNNFSFVKDPGTTRVPLGREDRGKRRVATPPADSLVEPGGLEPPTPCLQSRRSPD
jgi:hypothetical protein